MTGLQSMIESKKFKGGLTIFGINPGMPVGLNKPVTEFILRTVAGPRLYSPRIFLTIISRAAVIPINIGMPSSNLVSKDTSCEPPDSYTKNQYTCNIMSNYGEDLTIMFGTLAINIAISLLCYSLLRWTTLRKSKSIIFEVVDIVYRNYGIKYAIIKLAGISFES